MPERVFRQQDLPWPIGDLPLGVKANERRLPMRNIDPEGSVAVETLSELDRNYVEAHRIFMGSSETGEYVERRDVAIVSTGLPLPRMNWGFPKPPCEDLQEAAAAVFGPISRIGSFPSSSRCAAITHVDVRRFSKGAAGARGAIPCPA